MKSIAIPEDLHKEIMLLRLQKGNKNIAELIKELLYSYRQKQFLEASHLFKEELKKKNISFEKFLKDSDKIREELADGKF